MRHRQVALDAVARPGSVGMISLGQVKGPAQAVPLAVKRFDFLAKNGGELSLEELVLAQKVAKTYQK